MSIEFHVYAGPVLVCKYHFNEIVTHETLKKTVCPVCPVSRKSTAKFCSECGSQTVIQEEERQIKRRQKSVDSIYDLMIEGEFQEDAFHECWGGLNNEELIYGHDLFEPNTWLKHSKNAPLKFEVRDFYIHLRGAPDIAGQVAECEKFYAKELEYLRTKYDSVTVEWMVLTNGR